MRRDFLRRLVLLCGVLCSGILAAGLPLLRAGDWPRFLGPAQTGVSTETGLLKKWPAGGPPVLWTKLIGEGYSAPSIAGDRLVVTHRIRREDHVDCLNPATGEVHWSKTFPTSFSDPYGYNGGPRATPLLWEDRCITFSAQGVLRAQSLATGELLWEVETARRWTIPEAFFGAGCSPVMAGDKLIVAIGGQPDSGVAAFDPGTGKVLWEAVGKKTWEGVVGNNGKPYRWTDDEMIVSYSTPVHAVIDGRDHLLCLLRQGLVSLDPANGRERFHFWFRSKAHESVNAACPVVQGRQILLAAAYDVGSVLLEVNAEGTEVRTVWRQPRQLAAHWSTPIVRDDVIYGFSGRHENEARFQAVDWTTGELLWETSGYDGTLNDLTVDPVARQFLDPETKKPIPWPFFGRGSMLWAEDRAILWGERGTLALAEPSRARYRELARASWPNLSYPCWAAPVLADGRLWLRDEDSLVCFDLRAKK